MGRNIDTVTRRGNRKEREGEKESERVERRGAEGLRDSFVYMRLHAARVYTMTAGVSGDGEHCPISRPFFSIFLGVRSRFSAR